MCEKGCQLYQLLLMPCAAVQQLPHVRRGACDWTAGEAGGRGALVPFCDYRWQCFLFKRKITYSLESCEFFFKNQNEQIFLNFTLSFYERKQIFVIQNGQS
jgi:hypothetical protein